MKNPQIVINGFSGKYEQRMAQVLAAVPRKFQVEKMIFLCGEEFPLEAAKKFPVKSLVMVRSRLYDPEKILQVLEELTSQEDWVLFDSGYAAEELAARLAQRKQGVSALKVQELAVREEQLYCTKMVYSNHMMGTFQIRRLPCCISFAPGGTEKTVPQNGEEPVIQERFVQTGLEGYQLEETQEEGGLEQTRFLLAAGRGAGSRKQVEELGRIALSIGAEFGVSRPAAMSAWAPMDRLIGVSGALTKPKICIAAGASGAPAFYAGIEKSEFIVGINTDEHAELMKKSDVAVIGDCVEVLQALKQVIREDKES